MAVLIGSARIDENGRIHGGAAGDQTGKEISTQKWYKHARGWRVFRPLSEADANKIAECMEKACRNANIGYDQWQRDTLYEALKNKGFDPSRLRRKVETDCSALVRVCCGYAGIMLPDFNTQTEPIRLLDSNRFLEMIGTRYQASDAYLKRGDILVTSSKGHTAVVLTNGPKADKMIFNAGVTVTGEAVYLRRGPGRQHSAITVLHKGDTLEYVGITDDQQWFLVWYKGEAAWISTKWAKL